MERRMLPPGTRLYLPSLPPETTEQDIVDLFDRAEIYLTLEHVEIRPLNPTITKWTDRVAATVSVPNAQVAKLVQAQLKRNGAKLPNQRFSRHGWKVHVKPFGSKKEDKSYAGVHMPVTPQAEQASDSVAGWPPQGVCVPVHGLNHRV